ncbi:MAG: ergothioneine biosynthesis protein EgtB [Acidobacteria bacterium]|nr:ergothioneine biosynthesis protein EgtB [Acidobacteriota bacterium]MDW7983353.1 selenoneine synthase SenA [Acidobacteriota bacterium]
MTKVEIPIAPERLAEWVIEARRCTIELVADLTHEQLIGQRLDIVNPLLWEIGHVAWFQERWVLRHVCGMEPVRPDVDALYDSIAIPHELRWDLPLPSLDETLAYMEAVRDRVVDQLHRGTPPETLKYFVLYTIFHEDMHDEALTYTRQTLSYPAPRLSIVGPSHLETQGGPLPGDVEVPGGEFQLGATPDEPFVFDNEKWAHPVRVEPFAIARAPVTQAEFLAFVEDGGYDRPEFWSESGWRWRQAVGAHHPVYWQKERNGVWLRRCFDAWVPLEPHKPVIHVNWYEAEAYCRWARRRLPTEAEWELAASAEPTSDGLGITNRKRRFPWGDDPPDPTRAHMDWQSMDCIDVGARPAGDSAFGCRQMIGNVWEWTADDFRPYPGFVPDPYREYSQPWFRTHKVLRGGCWVTRSRLIRNTWRNFYEPHRRDVWAGFRTCAVRV